VSRLQVVKAMAEVAGVEESRMAQRMIGYAQARRIPKAGDFEALIGEVADAEARALDAGRPYPFYLAQSWQRPLPEMGETLGAPKDWIVEWKFDGIRAQLIRRGEGWRLWSRGEELISDAYPDLEPLALALPSNVALDGELVVLDPPAGETRPDSLEGLEAFASLQQRLGRKVVTEKTLKELPIAFIAYDLLELEGRDLRAEPQSERRALLERLAAGLFDEARAQGGRLPIRISPAIAADTWEALAEVREQARALGREGLMLKARAGAYGVGRRKGDDRTDVWWKWKLDPMSVDAVLIYAQRGQGRRSGVYSDYTFALWSAGEDEQGRELVPFAKAYSGLSDAEMREMDAIIRKTTVETFGPVRSVKPTQVFELGFEGIALSKRHRSGVAVRFPRMLRWRRDKPVAEADTLDALKALLPAGRR
jgi:DNA ligase-1